MGRILAINTAHVLKFHKSLPHENRNKEIKKTGMKTAVSDPAA